MRPVRIKHGDRHSGELDPGLAANRQPVQLRPSRRCHTARRGLGWRLILGDMSPVAKHEPRSPGVFKEEEERADDGTRTHDVLHGKGVVASGSVARQAARLTPLWLPVSRRRKYCHGGGMAFAHHHGVAWQGSTMAIIAPSGGPSEMAGLQGKSRRVRGPRPLGQQWTRLPLTRQVLSRRGHGLRPLISDGDRPASRGAPLGRHRRRLALAHDLAKHHHAASGDRSGSKPATYGFVDRHTFAYSRGTSVGARSDVRPG